MLGKYGQTLALVRLSEHKLLGKHVDVGVSLCCCLEIKFSPLILPLTNLANYQRVGCAVQNPYSP